MPAAHESRPPSRAASSAVELCNSALRLRADGKSLQALEAAQEAVVVLRDFILHDRSATLPLLAHGLDILGLAHRDLDHQVEARQAMQDAVQLWREVAASDRAAFLDHLATSLNNLGGTLSEGGLHSQALAVAEEVAALYHELAKARPGAYQADLAMASNNLGNMLYRSGRYAEAVAAHEEAVKLRQQLATNDPDALTLGLVSSMQNLGASLLEAGRTGDAFKVLCMAAKVCDRLSERQRKPVLPILASSLFNLGRVWVRARQDREAASAFHASAMLRLEFADREGLATSCEMAADALNRIGDGQAIALWRLCASVTLDVTPSDPARWTARARHLTQVLAETEDLRRWHLPLLRLLVGHRELAWNSDHAAVFLELQAEVAARVWAVLATLPAEDGDLLDEGIAALVTTLHSPDLARWLKTRGAGDGPLAKLAELKREVIETEQLLAALRKGLPGDGDTGLRALSSGPGTEVQRDALMNDIERQAAKAQALRQAFRGERARLVAEDPRFAAAFEPIGAEALRSIARHAQGGALLCVLELGSAGTVGQPEPPSPDRRRSVAALLHADGRRTQLLEFSGLSELAWHAQSYRPEALGVSRRGPLRGAPPSESGSASDGAPPPTFTDLLAPRMSQTFWAPLQQALRASGVAVERLHVCLHGTTQQLPLGLRRDGDCPGLQLIPWPGLPYVRRAAMATTTADDTAKAASAPWLVGHDCAWGSEQPLPMVAVEAALLRDLLRRHEEPVKAIRCAAELKGQPLALVACCHGGAEQAQFDHALHLGAEPLTVRQIVQDNIGPPLALLPACHAGRTDEDAAGNALGVAAAFMLSGTQVVAASSKAVPDLLQPWLSTLTVWHAMQGLPHHEAANLAREQFARLDFPAGYRSWLQEALPQALVTIQPGGEEDEHIRGVHAQTALEQVEERWPWEGETKDLFSADPARREEATRSVVQGILRPRGGEPGARALAAEAREMAAFVFVYGVARNDASPGIAEGTTASAEPTDAARPDQHAAQPRPHAALAPSTPRMAEDLTTPPVPYQPKAKPPASGLHGRLRALIGRWEPGRLPPARWSPSGGRRRRSRPWTAGVGEDRSDGEAGYAGRTLSPHSFSRSIKRFRCGCASRISGVMLKLPSANRLRSRSSSGR